MSLDKSRIHKRGNSSGKFIPEEQRTRTGKGKMVSGRMVETKSQKSSDEQKNYVRSGGPSGPGHA